MKVGIVASSPQDPQESLFLSSFVVNDTVAVDAGSLGLYRDPDAQTAIQHVFLTHSHADHVGSLPVFLENTAWSRTESPRVYGSPETLDSLRRDVFNDRVWPDLSRLAGSNGSFLHLVELDAERPVEMDGLRVTPVPVNHPVPTFGYLIDDGRMTVAFGADSGPTERIWELARTLPPLRAVFLECTFPGGMSAHAHKTGHLTPPLVDAESRKIPSETEIIVIHIRPAFRVRVEAELAALGLSSLQLGRGGTVYDF